MPEVISQLYKQITVSGPDAVEFLQGQLTQDVGRLADEGRLLAANQTALRFAGVKEEEVIDGETVARLAGSSLPSESEQVSTV